MNFDYKLFAEHIKPMSSIVSVEVFPDGTYGNIRIVTANSAFFAMSDQVCEDIGEEAVHKVDFEPDLPYEKYIPKDKNFEELCYRSAILGETVHTYIRPERAVGWNIAEIGFHAPQAIEKQAVHVVIPAFKEAGLRHPRIDGNGGEGSVRQVHVCFDLRVTEAKDRKTGFPNIHAILADIFQPLGNAALISLTWIKIALGEIAVFIQRFPVPEGDFLTCLCHDTQFRIACQVLPEIKDGFSARRMDDPAGKALLFQYRYAFRWSQIGKPKISNDHTMPVSDLLHAGVIAFANLQVVQACRSILTGFPVFITDQIGLAVHFHLA